MQEYIKKYLIICELQKKLDSKTLKAYRIDLRQFDDFLMGAPASKEVLSRYIMEMNSKFKPRSVKRKIASLKAFFHYLENEEILEDNPFRKLTIGMREPVQLPRTVPLRTIEAMLIAAHEKADNSLYALRDTAVLELLFATGMRVSELCQLNVSDIDLVEGVVRIHGKGAKERILQIGNVNVLSVLQNYSDTALRDGTEAFVTNRAGRRISEQSVRLILRRYEKLLHEPLHITPHMFRHSFATLLLEEDVDIRYIQQMLGHSSIVTTQIYTHVATAKQRDILATKHPRNRMNI